MNNYIRLTFCSIFFLLAACSSTQATPVPPTTVPASAAQPTSAPPATNAPAVASSSLALTSTAFTDGGDIPKKYSCQGDKTSPELKWSGASSATKSYALIVEDPDAPSGTFIHWVAYDIHASQTEIPEGAGTAGVSGKNSARQDGYTPPCPPSGTHRYIFNLYALDVPSLNLQPGATRDQVTSAMSAHILAQVKLTGRYAKQ